MISSPAKRAVDTCNIFTNTLKISDEIIHINPIIYDFQGKKTLNFIRSLDNNYQKVMLIGHNYAFTYLANLLGNTFIENLPTSGLIMIRFNIKNWFHIDKGDTQLVLFPKSLK